MTNQAKIKQLVKNVEERSREYNGGDTCYPFIVGWLESAMTNILEYNRSLDSELEKSKFKN
jgi:hypothetical protein